ncbi:tetratricopeptide repeat protein [Fulvivirga imtechensis]|nr:tetratricopeptide repeat protein [Fulvivirga imtechensis]
MKFLISFALLLSFAAKASDIDSLKLLAESSREEVRLEALYQLSKRLYPTDPGLAYDYALQQKQLASRVGNQLWLGKAYGILAYIDTKEGALDKAVSNYVNAIEIFKALKKYLHLADNYYNLGDIFLLAEDYNNAQKYFEKAYELFSNEGDETYFSWINLNIGRCLAAKGKHSEAIEKYNKAILQANGDSYILNLVYNRMGISYYEEGKYDLARDNYLKSISIDNLTDKKRKEIIAFNNIGESYLAEEKFDKAADLFNHSLDLVQQVRDPDFKLRGITLLNFGQLHFERSEYSKASEYLRSIALDTKSDIINRDLLKALKLLNKIHNIEAEKNQYPDGKEMLLYENLYNEQLTLIDELNHKLMSLNNQYMLQVNYEVPLLKGQVEELVAALKESRVYMAIAILVAILIAIPLFIHLRRAYLVRKVLAG